MRTPRNTTGKRLMKRRIPYFITKTILMQWWESLRLERKRCAYRHWSETLNLLSLHVPLALWSISVSQSETFKTPPLCFVTQNIGEVARSDGGVENDISSVCLYPFSPAVSRRITGCCVSNIGETPQEQPFLRWGVRCIKIPSDFLLNLNKTRPEYLINTPALLHLNNISSHFSPI